MYVSYCLFFFCSASLHEIHSTIQRHAPGWTCSGSKWGHIMLLKTKLRFDCQASLTQLYFGSQVSFYLLHWIVNSTIVFFFLRFFNF